MELLTAERLKEMSSGNVFDKGEGIIYAILPTPVKWVACKGQGVMDDWAIFYESPMYDYSYIRKYGAKITDISIVAELIPCDDKAKAMYRM